MKLSEIEALRDTLTVLPTAAGRREFYTLTPSAFERLLQEREMLLEALRPFAVGAGTGTYSSLMREWGMADVLKQTEAAAAAIRKAES